MEQSELLNHLIRCFESLGIPYLLTGSIASMAYGEPRFTNDIDIVADIKTEHIKGLKDCFPEQEFYLSEDAIKEAVNMFEKVKRQSEGLATGSISAILSILQPD